MADINLPAGAIASPSINLTADTVQVVRFAEFIERLQVVNATPGTVVRWTSDGSTPTADHGYYLPWPAVDERTPDIGGNTTVRLWASANTTVVVQRA